MDHIVVKVEPFVMEQKILVYKNGECVKIAKCTMENMADGISSLAHQYNINIVDIADKSAFSKKLKEKLSLSKYGKMTIILH